MPIPIGLEDRRLQHDVSVVRLLFFHHDLVDELLADGGLDLAGAVVELHGGLAAVVAHAVSRGRGRQRGGEAGQPRVLAGVARQRPASELGAAAVEVGVRVALLLTELPPPAADVLLLLLSQHQQLLLQQVDRLEQLDRDVGEYRGRDLR